MEHMFVPTTELPPEGLGGLDLEDGLVAMAGQSAAALCRELVWLAALEADLGWADTCMTASFCSWRLGDTPQAAKEKVAVARALGSLPRITEAFMAGRVSFSAVRAMVRVATPEIEEQLVGLARDCTGSMFTRIVRRYRSLLAEHAGGEPSASQHAARGLSYHFDEEGFFHVHGTFSPEAGAVIEAALDRAAAEVRAAQAELSPKDSPASGTRPPWEVRSADALLAICESYNAHGDQCRPGAARNEVVVHVDAAVLAGARGRGLESGDEESVGAEAVGAKAETEAKAARGEGEEPGAEAAGAEGEPVGAGEAWAEPAGGEPEAETAAEAPEAGTPEAGTPEAGTGLLVGDRPRCELEAGDAPIGPEAARRIACDASVVALIEDGSGVPLSVGRRSRSIPTAIRRALEARDGGCVFPGCGERRYVEGHHIVHWAHGGETSLSNLACLCFGHHRAIHEGGYRVEATSPGGFAFFRPDGSVVGGRATRVTPAAHAPQHYPVVARDTLCQYLGGGLNLGDALLRLYGVDGRFSAVAPEVLDQAVRPPGKEPEEFPVENAWMYEENTEPFELGPARYDWQDPPPPPPTG